MRDVDVALLRRTQKADADQEALRKIEVEAEESRVEDHLAIDFEVLRDAMQDPLRDQRIQPDGTEDPLADTLLDELAAQVDEAAGIQQQVEAQGASRVDAGGDHGARDDDDRDEVNAEDGEAAADTSSPGLAMLERLAALGGGHSEVGGRLDEGNGSDPLAALGLDAFDIYEGLLPDSLDVLGTDPLEGLGEAPDLDLSSLPPASLDALVGQPRDAAAVPSKAFPEVDTSMSADAEAQLPQVEPAGLGTLSSLREAPSGATAPTWGAVLGPMIDAMAPFAPALVAAAPGAFSAVVSGVGAAMSAGMGAVQLRETGAFEELDDQAVQAIAAEGASTSASMLPFAQRIFAAFGAYAPEGVRAHVGSDAAAAAEAIGAQAYATGSDIVFGVTPSIDLVAHELAHVVQQQLGVVPAGMISTPGDRFERQADEVAARVARGESVEDLFDALMGAVEPAATGEVDSPAEPVAAGITELAADADTADGAADEEAAGLADAETAGAEGVQECGDPDCREEPDGELAPPEPASQEDLDLEIEEDPLDEDVEEDEEPEAEEAVEAPDAAPAAEAAPEPEPESEPEAAAPAPADVQGEVAAPVVEEAIEEPPAADIQDVLAGATGSVGVTEAFTSASPSEQASSWSDFGDKLDSAVKEESESLDEAVPDLEATMTGDELEAPKVEVEVPDIDSSVGDDAPSPTPDVEIEPTKDPGPSDAGKAAVAALSTIEEVEEGDASAREDDLKAAMSQVSTTDGAVDTSPGPRPELPLEGEADPSRVVNKACEVKQEAAQAAQQAAQAVADSPGAELVVPLELNEVFEAPSLDLPEIDGAGAVSELEEFIELNLPEDLVSAFDADYAAEFQDSLEGARSEVDKGVAERNDAFAAEIAEVQREAHDLNQEAQKQQADEVKAQREAIESERADTVKKQQQAMDEARADIDAEQSSELKSIDDRIKDDERKVDAEYSKAEQQAKAKVAEGERKAEAEKKKADQDSKKKSWWSRAVSAVSSAISKLADAVTAVFDKVREAVSALIDKAKEYANKIIDATVNFIQNAVSMFGDWLKKKIQELLGDIFPELAAALCAFVDKAVDTVNAYVEELGESLKEGINNLLDALEAGLNKILDVFEAVAQTALAFAEAMITGDWTGFIIKLLESAMKVAGVPEEEFYSYVGKAEETLRLIVEEPGKFISNLIKAVGQGFGQFSDNFMGHLQTGFVNWLTGEMGDSGIQMPEKFDLAGVFSLVLQILGLTPDKLREKAVEHIGEDNVAMIEYVWGYVDAAITGGLEGLWEHVKSELSGLWDMVVGAIQSWLMETIVKKAVTKIATMFNPVGALIQAVLLAWDVFQWITSQIQRIWGVVTAIISSVHDIATGSLDGAANMVEGALAGLIPVAIDLLARLLGLSGIGKKVKEIIENIQSKVSDAIDAMIEKVKGLFKGGGDGSEDDDGSLGVPEGPLTEKLPVKLGDENHHIYADFRNGEVALIMESTPTPLDEAMDGEAEAQELQQSFRSKATSTVGGWVRNGKNWVGKAWDGLTKSAAAIKEKKDKRVAKLKEDAKEFANKAVKYVESKTDNGIDELAILGKTKLFGISLGHFNLETEVERKETKRKVAVKGEIDLFKSGLSKLGYLPELDIGALVGAELAESLSPLTVKGGFVVEIEGSLEIDDAKDTVTWDLGAKFGESSLDVAWNLTAGPLAAVLKGSVGGSVKFTPYEFKPFAGSTTTDTAAKPNKMQPRTAEGELYFKLKLGTVVTAVVAASRALGKLAVKVAGAFKDKSDIDGAEKHEGNKAAGGNKFTDTLGKIGTGIKDAGLKTSSKIMENVSSNWADGELKLKLLGVKLTMDSDAETGESDNKWEFSGVVAEGAKAVAEIGRRLWKGVNKAKDYVKDLTTWEINLDFDEEDLNTLTSDMASEFDE